ncbi:MAG: ATP-binding protein [Lachnospiraceae bacterium]|nr:ATP-binding protein [Lachnospiraceae bacterium]
MEFKVGVGKSDFAALRESGNYYVDKTRLIYELVNDTDNQVTLFTRPRRFGKTLMMSMMENFFSIRKDSKLIFEGLAITEHENFCKEWMNQYPVLFVSFKDVEAEEFADAYDMLGVRLADVCKDLADAIDTDAVDKDDRNAFRRLKAESGKKSDIKNSLKTLMRMMSVVYGKKVILLIDEYDVPLAKASEMDASKNGYYSGMLDIIKGIMSTALKDNEFLQFAVITGCLRIAKESIFTGTNNFASYSVLDEDFSEYFGFSGDEVDAILEAADRKDKADIIKKWYDGYVFGNSYVYCPWDVINYLSALKRRKDAKPKNYWKNTSHNGILLTFVKHSDFDVAGKFEKLLNEGTIVQMISDELTYDTIHFTEDNLWSVLLMTGYVTKADPDEDGDTVSLKIPNKEIASIFQDSVIRYFTDTVNSDTIQNLMGSLWEKDEIRSGEILSGLLWDTISYNDYHEDYYHAFLAGVFVGRGYEVESNKEKGLGRPDILLKDRKNRRALIIEAKKSDKESGLDKACDKAIKQIIDEKYAEGLYGYDQILCYGVAFFQKQAKVKLLTTLKYESKI